MISVQELLIWYPALVAANSYLSVGLLSKLDSFMDDCPSYLSDDKCNQTSHHHSPSGEPNNQGQIQTTNGPSIPYEYQRHTSVSTTKSIGYMAIIWLSIVVVLWGVLVGIVVKQKCICGGDSDRIAQEDTKTFNATAKALAIFTLLLCSTSSFFVYNWNQIVRGCSTNEWAMKDDGIETEQSTYLTMGDIASACVGLSLPALAYVLIKTFSADASSLTQNVD